MRCLEPNNEDFENSDQLAGKDIVIKACGAPFYNIMKNAGLNPEVVWNKIESANNENCGYDARKEEVADMFDVGIIDPAKVTRVALEKAASVAGTLLTTQCVITKKPSEGGAEPAMAGGGFGMM